jgi:pyrroline-5-carboxylate reductase
MNSINSVLGKSGPVAYVSEANTGLLHGFKTSGAGMFGAVVEVLDDFFVRIGKSSPHL